MKSRGPVIYVLINFLAVTQLTAQDPISRDVFTAERAPIVYHDTFFLYTGHDTGLHPGASFKNDGGLNCCRMACLNDGSEGYGKLRTGQHRILYFFINK